MAKGFDGLIEYLLEEIALCGEIGTSLSFGHPKAFRDREFSPRKKGSAEIRNDHSVPAYDRLFYLIPTGCTTSTMTVRFSAEMKRKTFYNILLLLTN